MKSGRVPSYKAIALCLLKNDMQLRWIGFGRAESKTVETLIQIKKTSNENQLSLF